MVSSAQYRKAIVNARDCRTRQVAAIFRTSKSNLRGSLFIITILILFFCSFACISCVYGKVLVLLLSILTFNKELVEKPSE